MKVKTIENLPEEVLIEIFECLDVKAILESTLVCQRWNEIISNSYRVMSKVKVISKYMKEFFDSQRKYVNIKMFRSTVRHCKLLRPLDDVQRSLLKSITFTECVLDDINLKNITDACQNLESLCLQNVKFENACRIVTPATSISSKKLKTLEVSKCCMRLLKHFNSVELTSIKLEDPLNVSSTILGDFISSQKKLESLTLRMDSATFFWIFMTRTFKVTGEECGNLKQLLIFVDGCQYKVMPIQSEANFIEFLALRGSNLEEFSFDGVREGLIHQFALKKLKNLKSLVLNSKNMTRKSHLVGRTISSRMEKLNIEGPKIGYNEPDTVEANLLCFPKIKCLKLATPNRKILSSASKTLPKIETLSFYSLPEINCEFKFKKLKEVQLEFVNSFYPVQTLIDNNPTIERISIKNLKSDNKKNRFENLVKSLTSNKMKHIKVQGGIIILKMFYEALKKVKWNCPLETVELIINSESEDFVRSIIFYVPKHKDSWIPENTVLESKSSLSQ